jgi:hypothetical protein
VYANKKLKYSKTNIHRAESTMKQLAMSQYPDIKDNKLTIAFVCTASLKMPNPLFLFLFFLGLTV